MNKKIVSSKLYIVILILLITSCTSLENYFSKIPNFDQKSYEHFTFLKADVVMFYDTLTKTVDYQKVNDYFLVAFNRYIEYEKGKTGNDEIVNQLNTIRSMFVRHCNNAKENPYSETMKDNRKEIISKAFDILISTEYLKKK